MRFHRRDRQSSGRVIALVAAILLSPSSFAQLTATANLRVDSAFGATLFNDFRQDSSNTANRAAMSLSFLTGFVEPHTFAAAEVGVLRASSRADSEHPGAEEFQAETSIATAWAEFSDTIVPLAQNAAVGTMVQGTFIMDLAAAFSFQNGGITDGASLQLGRGDVVLELQVGGTFSNLAYRTSFSYIGGPNAVFEVQRRKSPATALTTILFDNFADNLGGHGVREPVAVTANFVLGSPLAVRARLTTFASSRARNIGDSLVFVADAANTASWGGIKDVQLLNGDPLLGFSAIGESSRLEFAQTLHPVPLPPPVWLSLTGLAGVMALVRAKSGEARTEDGASSTLQ